MFKEYEAMELSAEKHPDETPLMALADDAFLAILEHHGPQYRCLLAVSKELDAVIKPQLNLRFFARHQTAAIESIPWFLRTIEMEHGCRPSLPEDCFQTLKQIAEVNKSWYKRVECQHDAVWYLQHLASYMSRAQQNQVRPILCDKYPYFLILEYYNKPMQPLLFEGWYAAEQVFKAYSPKMQEALISDLYRCVDDQNLRVRDAALQCLLKICAYQNYPEPMINAFYNKLEALLQAVTWRHNPNESQVILFCLRDIIPHSAQKQRIFDVLFKYDDLQGYQAGHRFDTLLKLEVMTILLECSDKPVRAELCKKALGRYQEEDSYSAARRKAQDEYRDIGYYPAFELSVLTLFYPHVDQALRNTILGFVEVANKKHDDLVYTHYPYNPFWLLDWKRKCNLIQQYTTALAEGLDRDSKYPEGLSSTRLYLEGVSGLLKAVRDETELEQAKAHFLAWLSSRQSAERCVALYVFVSCADKFDKATQERVAMLIKEQSLAEDQDGTVSWQTLQADVTRYSQGMTLGHIASLRAGVYAPLAYVLISHCSLAEISAIFLRLNQALENSDRYQYLSILTKALSRVHPEVMPPAILDALLESYEAYLKNHIVYDDTVFARAIFWMLPLFLSGQHSANEEKIRVFLAKRSKDIELLPLGTLPLFLRFLEGEHAIAIPRASEAPTVHVARLLSDWRQGLRLQEKPKPDIQLSFFIEAIKVQEAKEREARSFTCAIL